ncbi:MAG: BCCT family transporter, partial [Pseudomonadales bacterium]|nr:BCCT family transporter [Pseudomonadales bacterium]
INIFLAVMLLVCVLAFGPTVYLLQMFMQNTGSYIADIVGKTFNLYAYEPTDWLGGWTIFYWGWWISWAPFVGLFIARISRGRTLREFVFGALAAPTLFTLLWMTVFGNSAIALILDQGMVELATAVRLDESVALFKFLEDVPGSTILSLLAIAMVFVFFITSADSGAMVLNMLSSNGRDDTPLVRRVFWMAMIGSSALLLLLAGGLSALQTATIASALPFSVVILIAIWGFVRALSIDHAKRQTLLLTNVGPTGGPESMDWKLRLRNLLRHASQEDVTGFIESTVMGAMGQFSEELKMQGLTVRLELEEPKIAKLSVLHGEEIDFQYAVAARLHALPSDAVMGEVVRGEDNYFRAEVQLNEGSQDYDVMGWTQSQVLHDLLEQYEKHLHFLHTLR